MKVVVSPTEAAGFSERLTTGEYRSQERDYEVAVHLVLAALLSEQTRAGEDFPSLLAEVFREPLPDLAALGVSANDQAFIHEALASFGSWRTAECDGKSCRRKVGACPIRLDSASYRVRPQHHHR